MKCKIVLLFTTIVNYGYSFNAVASETYTTHTLVQNITTAYNLCALYENSMIFQPYHRVNKWIERQAQKQSISTCLFAVHLTYPRIDSHGIIQRTVIPTATWWIEHHKNDIFELCKNYFENYQDASNSSQVLITLAHLAACARFTSNDFRQIKPSSPLAKSSLISIQSFVDSYLKSQYNS